MSGGHFEGDQYKIIEIAREIEYVIKHNTTKNEYGYSYDYHKEILDIFQEIAGELRILKNKVHCIDYLLCGDYGEDDFLGRIKEIKKDGNNKK